MATVDSETRRKANLRVLQRIDSNIVDLAITATHVVLYEYSLTKKTWEKKNVEGSLFVTKRSDAPRFKLIVLNRNSTDNLEVPITSTFQMQVRDPYMIIRDSSNGNNQAIRGIWFHDGKERDSVASYLENVVKSLVKIEEMEKAHPDVFNVMLQMLDNNPVVVVMQMPVLHSWQPSPREASHLRHNQPRQEIQMKPNNLLQVLLLQQQEPISKILYWIRRISNFRCSVLFKTRGFWTSFMPSTLKWSTLELLVSRKMESNNRCNKWLREKVCTCVTS